MANGLPLRQECSRLLLRRRSATPLPHHTLPTPRTSNSGLPFLSFDVNSAAASGFFTAALSFTPPSAAADPPDSMTTPRSSKNSEFNTKKIYQKTLSIINPFRINYHLHEDADLSGPFLLLMAFGLFQLLAGKLHFGIILGWVMESMFLYIVFNILAGKNGNLDMYKCLSLIGYCMLPIVMLSALSLLLPWSWLAVATSTED